MLSNYLTGGKSSVLYKKYVDEKKEALQIFAFNRQMEDYGIYTIGVLPQGKVSLEQLEKDIQKDIENVQTNLISEEDYQKLLNSFENSFVAQRQGVENIAHLLADAYMLQGDTNKINTEMDIYRSITREDIRNVAKKYLGKNQRVIVQYLPESAKEQKEKNS